VRADAIADGPSGSSRSQPCDGADPMLCLDVAWPAITVGASDFVVNPARTAAWSSSDGGATWTTTG
jgi:hypothetical protein